jgi:hypothetical protein
MKNYKILICSYKKLKLNNTTNIILNVMYNIQIMSTQLNISDCDLTIKAIDAFKTDINMSHLWPFISSILPVIDVDELFPVISIGVTDLDAMDIFPSEIRCINNDGIIYYVTIKTYYDEIVN